MFGLSIDTAKARSHYSHLLNSNRMGIVTAMASSTERISLRKKAHSGQAKDLFQLACSYDFDRPKDKRTAIRWYKKAAKLGHADAQNFLGESYREGWSTKQNYEKAVQFFKLAAKQGQIDAQVNLGVCPRYGEGIERNDEQALKWYRRAAKNGNDKAMSNIGRIYMDGEAVQQSWSKAIYWYKKAAALGNAVSYTHLTLPTNREV